VALAPDASATHRRWPWWTPAVAVGILAVVAVVLSAPLVAALAAVVAVGLVILSRPPPAPSAVTAEADPHVAAAAAALIAAQVRCEGTANAVAVAAGAVDGATGDLARVREEVRLLARSLHVPVAETPEASAALHQAWLVANAAVVDEQRAAERLGEAVGRVAHARAQVGHAEAAIGDALRGCGVSVEVPPRGSPASLGRFRAASGTYHEVVSARTSFAHAMVALDLLIAPVAATTVGWSAERVAEDARRWATRSDDIAKLVASIASSRRLIEARLGDDPTVRALCDRGLTPFELESEARDAEAERDAIQAESEAVGERIGELRHTQEQLAQVERLGALHVERGTLLEHQQDLALRALAATMAAAILGSVADEYERAHQPALIERTAAMARLVAPSWAGVLVRPNSDGGDLELLVQEQSGVAVPTSKLSTGARALLYLSLRVAMAEHDADSRRLRLPLLCDDPLVHLDDERAHHVVQVLNAASQAGHQVVLFTCHDRTVQVARKVGAHVANL